MALFDDKKKDKDPLKDLDGADDQTSIIKLVDGLIESAQKNNASDIHLDPQEDGILVRMRIDGILQDLYHVPKSIHSEVVSRLKILTGLRTDEHQMAQDGRFRHIFKDNTFVDIRVSVSPTYHGENVVLRLLSDKSQNYTLDSLGFSEADQEKIKTAIKKPNGMVLATGPTGSGKTTTLYTLIKMLNSKEISVLTIEDPIEYAIENVEQIQVNPHAGLTFANGLRTILRQDPNIIMVGEIRDPETATIAVNTALTGTLLLSSLHTNDAATTMPRLLEMGIEPYLVASTMNIAIAQRLVRKICEHCKKEKKLTKAIVESLSHVQLSTPLKAGEVFFAGAGCTKCTGSGYAGRIGINEVLVVDQEVRDAILARVPSGEIKKIAMKNGMTSMIEDGFNKARAGQTTIEEVLRVVNE
ncbi:MAG: GspE/PulE family protein [Patescibacteria group bacterium]